MTPTAALVQRAGGVQLTTFDDYQRFALQAAVSGLAGVTGKSREVAAAEVLMRVQYGAELGLGPMTALQGVHVIQGKPCLSAGLMASLIQASGRYSYRVVEHTDRVCELAFFDGSTEVGRARFTMDDAKRAGLTSGKNAHSWSKWPANMLFARAMSNGARWHCPGVFAGAAYSVEEMEDADAPPRPTPQQRVRAIDAEVDVDGVVVEPDAEHQQTEAATMLSLLQAELSQWQADPRLPPKVRGRVEHLSGGSPTLEELRRAVRYLREKFVRPQDDLTSDAGAELWDEAPPAELTFDEAPPPRDSKPATLRQIERLTQYASNEQLDEGLRDQIVALLERESISSGAAGTLLGAAKKQLGES